MRADDTTTSAGGTLAGGSDRLQSWKDIAAYLQRDVRTVRRWEEKENLPVHRHVHRKRGSVYASKAELDAWWTSGRGRLEDEAAADSPRHWIRRGLLLALLFLVVPACVWYFAQRRSAAALLSPPASHRLVVLPFDNLSGDPEKEYLSDGFTEELITQLGRAQPDGLEVIARTSAMHYKRLSKPVKEIGRELQVDYVLEGSVRVAGDRIRITAQLIRVRDQTHVWAEEYEREFRDVLALQRDVSQAVAHQIHLRLAAPEHAVRPRHIDPEAYQLYLKGRYLLNRRTGERQLARQCFEDAIARDPTYAAAYAGLADAYVRIVLFGPQPASQAWGQAEGAARRALELDETLPAAHSSMATIRLYRDWDFVGASRENQRAIALNPSDANAHAGYANQLRVAGLMDAAILERRRALELDPLRADLVTGLGVEYVFARRLDEGIDQFRQALQLDPQYKPAVKGIADAYERKGMDKEAAAQQVRVLNLNQQADLTATFERVYRAKGYAAAARLLDQRALEAYKKRPAEVNSWNVAFTYARLGDREAAFEWLEKAYAARDPGLLQIRVDPDVDNLRSDRRFADLLRRMNLQQ